MDCKSISFNQEELKVTVINIWFKCLDKHLCLARLRWTNLCEFKLQNLTCSGSSSASLLYTWATLVNCLLILIRSCYRAGGISELRVVGQETKQTISRVLCGNGDCTRMWCGIVGCFTLNPNFDFQFSSFAWSLKNLFVVHVDPLQLPLRIALSLWLVWNKHKLLQLFHHTAASLLCELSENETAVVLFNPDYELELQICGKRFLGLAEPRVGFGGSD